MAKKKKVATKQPEPIEARAEVIPKKYSEKSDEKTLVDIFSTLGNRAIWVVLGALLVICFIIFKDYLLLEKGYIFKDISCDSYTLSYPILYNTVDYFAHHGLPKWSFHSGMGQSIFPFILREPFNIFIFIFGKGSIYHIIIYLEVLKIVLAGIVFYYFLKQLKLSDFTALVGCLFYAFCGFMIEGSAWNVFTFEALDLAILLLAFELLFNKGSWYLFPVGIWLIGISMPFNLYVYGLFLALYVLLRHLQVGVFDIKKLGILYLKMFGLGVLGLILAGPFLLENIVQLLESPRGSGNSALSHLLASQPMFDLVDKMEFGSGIMRMFSNDLLHSGDNFRGWQNILEAPLYYCGLPCLLLMPQIFSFLSKRVKIVFLVFLFAWILPMFFPYFRHAFWLFTGDYYRAYSFFVGLVFIMYSVNALEFIIQKNKVNVIVLVATVVVLLGLLNYPFFDDKESVDQTIKMFVTIILVGYALLLFMMGRQKNIVLYKYVFLGLLFIELVYLGGITSNERNAITDAEMKAKIGYSDYTIDAINFIKKNDKSFFRVDKLYSSGLSHFSTLNDGMAQDYNGTSSYNPFNQLYYIKYLQAVEVAQKGNELDSRWARGLVNKPILECLNTVKYMLAIEKNVNPFWYVMCDTIGKFGDIKVFKNKFVLPLGFTYNCYIKEDVFGGLSSIQKQFVSLRACVVSEKDQKLVSGLKEFKLTDTVSLMAFNTDTLGNYVRELKQDTMIVSKFDENFISGNISVNEDKMMYLSIPNDAGWKLKVDGRPADKIILTSGMTGVWLTKGKHVIEMTFDLRYFNMGLIMSGFGIFLFAGLWFYTKRKKVEKSE